jgi:hypothetical protein
MVFLVGIPSIQSATHRLIVAMTEYAAYIDDSGHPSDQPFVIAAGFLATEPEWVAFEPEWRTALFEHGLGDVLHMTDFEKAYRNSPKKWVILHNLIDIILAHTGAHFVNVVAMADYRKVNSIYRLQECIGSPYSMAVRGIARSINVWKEKFFKADDKLLLFVENGTLHRGDMEEIFRRDGLPVPRYVPKSMPAVQAADWLAWEALYAHRRNYVRKTLKRVVEDESNWDGGGIWREPDLVRSCEMVRIPKREATASMEVVFHNAPKRKRHRTIG